MKLLIYMLTVTTIVFSMYVYINVNHQPYIGIKTIDSYYYAFENLKDSIEVPLYIEDSSKVVSDMQSIDRIKFHNTNIQFDGRLKDITRSHQEIYEDISYDVFEYHIELPKLGLYQFYDHMQMTLYFIDDTELTVYIGVLEYFINSLGDALKWTSIDLIRDNDIMTIRIINIQGVSCKMTVEMSKTYDVDRLCDARGMTVTLRDEGVIVTNIPIFMTLESQQEVIIGATQIHSLRMLSQTEGYQREYTYYYAS